jgi:hypothetical protein
MLLSHSSYCLGCSCWIVWYFWTEKRQYNPSSHLNLFNSKLTYTHISMNHVYIQQTKYAVVESITHACNDARLARGAGQDFGDRGGRGSQ